MTDGEGVAAEVHGVEAVIHHELGAEWVVHARPKHVGLRREEPPQPLAGILVSRCRDFVTLREEGRGDKIHLDLQLQTAKTPRGLGSTRSRDRSCTDPDTRTRDLTARLRPGSLPSAPACPCGRHYLCGRHQSNQLI